MKILNLLRGPKFRIIQRPSAVRPWDPIYEVQERVFPFVWDARGWFSTFDQALDRLHELEDHPSSVRRKVVYEKH
jgi:hypothetical protein